MKDVVTLICLLLAAGFADCMMDSPVAFVGAWACAFVMAAIWRKKAPACRNTIRG